MKFWKCFFCFDVWLRWRTFGRVTWTEKIQGPSCCSQFFGILEFCALLWNILFGFVVFGFARSRKLVPAILKYLFVRLSRRENYFVAGIKLHALYHWSVRRRVVVVVGVLGNEWSVLVRDITTVRWVFRFYALGTAALHLYRADLSCNWENWMIGCANKIIKLSQWNEVCLYLARRTIEMQFYGEIIYLETS